MPSHNFVFLRFTGLLVYSHFFFFLKQTSLQTSTQCTYLLIISFYLTNTFTVLCVVDVSHKFCHLLFKSG